MKEVQAKFQARVRVAGSNPAVLDDWVIRAKHRASLGRLNVHYVRNLEDRSGWAAALGLRRLSTGASNCGHRPARVHCICIRPLAAAIRAKRVPDTIPPLVPTRVCLAREIERRGHRLATYH